MMQSRAAAARKAAEAQALAARSATPTAGGSSAPPQTPGADGQAGGSQSGNNDSANGDGDVEMKDVKEEPQTGGSQNGSTSQAPAPPQQPKIPPTPLEHVDEIINMLKTAFPLLALMMEKMVDHISIRAKPNSEEDIYRFFAALLNDAMQVSSKKSTIFGDPFAHRFSNGVEGILYPTMRAN